MVIAASTGQEGFLSASTNNVGAVILNLMLHGRHGLDVLRELRARGFATPVLILTARDTVEDKVLGLDSGANDHLVKPFAFADLLAGLRVHFRRDLPVRKRVLRADNLEMDLLTRRVVRGVTILDLTGREYDLLEYLLRHKNEIVTRTSRPPCLSHQEIEHFANSWRFFSRPSRSPLPVPSRDEICSPGRPSHRSLT